eukprot:1664439-Amphidinium_carterae.1
MSSEVKSSLAVATNWASVSRRSPHAMSFALQVANGAIYFLFFYRKWSRTRFTLALVTLNSRCYPRNRAAALC